MKKTNLMLIVLNPDALDDAVKKLNLDNANLFAILSDASEINSVQVGDKTVPVLSYIDLYKFLRKSKKTYKRFVWVISGCINRLEDLIGVKNFLTAIGVPENNIVNLEPLLALSETWTANLRYIEEHGADYFATGNEYMQANLDFDSIPRVNADKTLEKGGVNLSDAGQDLRQSYQIAKHVFAHVAPGTIKFVLIGLTPTSFRYDSTKNFLYRKKNLQYVLTLDNVEDTPHDRWLKTLSLDVKNFADTVTAEQADLNFESIKQNHVGNFSVKSIIDWADDAKFLTNDDDEDNVQILKDYIQLCLDNGAKPVGVIFPCAPAVRIKYDQKLLADFRETIARLQENYEFMCVDLFDRFNYYCFSEIMYLNHSGRVYSNLLLAFSLNNKGLLPAESFCDMTYEYLDLLSEIAPKDDYNSFVDRVFQASAQMIRRKDKIKIGFVMYDSSMWAGDELYNYFAQDERFEVTIFLCLRPGSSKNDAIKQDFLQGIRLFKSHNLNVVAANKQSHLPAQDVLILLTPYLGRVSKAFQPKKLTARTLVTHIPYSFDISLRKKNYYNLTIFHTAWKVFFSSVIGLNVYTAKSTIGLPRGLFSGYPRIDIFFNKDVQFRFDWKMVRPDAKKIIYAPHHSITDDSVQYATFRWNYQFMYEFAKAHPEISWIVKPHPNLSYRSVKGKIFPSIAAFEAFMKKWDDLPNAMVYTGAYYQAIFATSDGMIHDSGSFIAEYQYVNKPMIFLTRDTQKFNELGNAILQASYCVDGKDLDSIAATMQKVFIEGNDDKIDERQAVFDKYLNYPKYNGMSASEFIYKTIADELKEVSQ